MGDDVDSGDVGLAGRRDDPGRQHAGGGRLSRAIRTEKPEDLAGMHGEIQPVHSREICPGIDLGELQSPDDLAAHTGRNCDGK